MVRFVAPLHRQIVVAIERAQVQRQRIGVRSWSNTLTLVEMRGSTMSPEISTLLRGAEQGHMLRRMPITHDDAPGCPPMATSSPCSRRVARRQRRAPGWGNSRRAGGSASAHPLRSARGGQSARLRPARPRRRHRHRRDHRLATMKSVMLIHSGAFQRSHSQCASPMWSGVHVGHQHAQHRQAFQFVLEHLLPDRLHFVARAMPQSMMVQPWRPSISSRSNHRLDVVQGEAAAASVSTHPSATTEGHAGLRVVSGPTGYCSSARSDSLPLPVLA